ncbi:MAG: hypothetical protein JWQ42_2625 [Edaphobacter sp.]|nr:hypothetical protein [Edaphobacter sp.]
MRAPKPSRRERSQLGVRGNALHIVPCSQILANILSECFVVAASGDLNQASSLKKLSVSRVDIPEIAPSLVSISRT